MNELSENHESDLDCAVCLLKCNHPTRLPCNHIFCFLCVKGIALQGRKCAMCRARIPVDYLDNPVLLPTQPEEEENTNPAQEVNLWFYEGKDGWWKYDERSNAELEAAFSTGENVCTLLLAGSLYDIHFRDMTQVKRTNQSRIRRVRRDTPMFPAKGIAGIKTNGNIQTISDDDDDVIYVNTTENVTIEISDEENDSEVLNESDLEPHQQVNNLIDSVR